MNAENTKETPPALESWLDEATRGIGTLGKTRIREEVGAHFREAYDAALAEGIAAENAERRAVEALGEARKARSGFRRAYLTVREERQLHQSLFGMRGTLTADVLKWPAIVLGAVFLLFGAFDLFDRNVTIDLFAICYLLLGCDFLLRERLVASHAIRRYFRWKVAVGTTMIGVSLYLMIANAGSFENWWVPWAFVGVIILMLAGFGPRQLTTWRKSRLFSPEDWTLLERRGGKKKN